jgi:L-ascorbate metabolism protein UlaG (beta-lactamase superfamily)
MYILFSLLLILTVIIIIFINQPQFGKISTGERMQRIKNSPNYREGEFQNLSKTPDLTEGANLISVMADFLFRRSRRSKPISPLPSRKTNLALIDPAKNLLVWFGHSSYFMQIDGKKFLVDPVFSGSASPLPNSVKSFAGSDIYTADDFPEIDYLIISHDHWDHLDYQTIKKLQPRVKKVITALGVAAHLEYWGYDKSIILERDWYEEIILENGFVLNTLPSRHFSGRGFKRKQSLWMSFVLRTTSIKIFIGGDSGYDKHFLKIGDQFGPFDLAILECGQYNKYWKHIHMMPEEVVQAAQDLRTNKLLPVHWSKFNLALHAWDEPIIRVTREAMIKNLTVIHPMIGEEVELGKEFISDKWWEKIR